MIKSIKYIIILMFLSYIGVAQQLPHYSLYMYNDAVINPAISGINDNDLLTLVYRNQWTGFEGAPKTQLLSYQRSQSDKIGLGMMFFNDVTGAISRTGTQLSYAYRIPLSNNYKLSLGLASSVYQYVWDDTRIQLYDEVYDPILSGAVEKTFVLDATFGTYIHSDKYYLGVAVPHLIESKININDSEGNKLVRHYFITTGYKFDLNSDVVIEPSILFKGTSATPFQYDVNFKINYKDYLWLGSSYRDQDAIVFMLGLNFNNYSFGYSYDKTTSDISSYNSGSHGIMLRYEFGNKKLKPSVVNQDRDNDGVSNDVDNCPDQPGTLENGGCPDSDGDGVIDKEDQCPKTPGLKTDKGCPILTKEQSAILDTAFVNLEFVFAKAEITFESYSHLERLGLMLSKNPEMRLRITGHTDNIGDDKVNMELSKNRSQAVKFFLTDRGIKADRIIALFYGENRPIAPNDTDEGRAKNRRVELTIFFE